MIIKSVVLRCDPERAFTLFTERAGDWWPADRRHTDDEQSAIHLEPGGRFFERAADGTEAELGAVRAFERPRRLVLDWYPGTGPEDPTLVEVTFEAIEGGTRVTVRHEAGVASEERFEAKVAGYDRSWDLVLAALERQA